MLSAIITTRKLLFIILLNAVTGRDSLAIIISELMPHPTETGEWIELYNDADAAMNISGYSLYDMAGSGGVLIEQQASILPRGFVILLGDSLSADRLNLPAGTVIIGPERLPTLNNDGDRLTLLDAGGYTVDEMEYSSDHAKYEGRSVERVEMHSSGTGPSSWGVCVDPAGHTAGRNNSLSPVENRKVSINAAPNPFSPDGDGIDETTFISFNVPAVESRITVGIYDQAGRKVRNLTSNCPAGSTVPSIEWDGSDDRGRRLAIGRYIIIMEALDYRGGSSFIAKCTVVLAGKL